MKVANPAASKSILAVLATAFPAKSKPNAVVAAPALYHTKPAISLGMTSE